MTIVHFTDHVGPRSGASSIKSWSAQRSSRSIAITGDLVDKRGGLRRS
jgi:hypothetical protein